MNNRTIVLLAAFAALTVAPAAQAEGVAVSPDCDAPRPPDYWVYACAEPEYHPLYVYAYGVDLTPPTERICPALGVCVDVPKPFYILYTAVYVVPYYTVRHDEEVDVGQIVEDVCNVLDPVCTYVGPFQTAQADLPHGLVYEATADLSGDLVDDHALFSLPSGEHVVLPLAA